MCEYDIGIITMELQRCQLVILGKFWKQQYGCHGQIQFKLIAQEQKYKNASHLVLSCLWH